MKTKLFTLCAAAMVATGLQTAPATAQNFYLGQLVLGGWTFCPRGTIAASGQLLAIASNQALFALLGTMYGGDGRTTFAMPDLRGRSVLSAGQGPGLQFIQQGQKGGAESHTLTLAELPSHNHALTNTVTAGISANPGAPAAGAAGNGLAGSATIYSGTGTPAQALMDGVVSVDVTSTVLDTGGNLNFGIRDPFLALQYCVVTEGVFPPRS